MLRLISNGRLDPSCLQRPQQLRGVGIFRHLYSAWSVYMCGLVRILAPTAVGTLVLLLHHPLILGNSHDCCAIYPFNIGRIRQYRGNANTLLAI